MNVGDYTATGMQRPNRQKLFRRSVSFGLESQQAEQSGERHPSRLVVVNNGYGQASQWSTSSWKLERLSHPHEIRERSGSHFAHRRAAMDFDRDQADAEIAGNLLIHLSGSCELHHLTLPR
jgi:hypothetical protein